MYVYNTRQPRGSLIKSRMNVTFITAHSAGRIFKGLLNHFVTSFYSTVTYRIF